MLEKNEELEALQDIRQMMQRSSRFLSLSGLSGMAAGLWALVGAWLARTKIVAYEGRYQKGETYSHHAFETFRLQLLLLAIGVLVLALLSAFYFTWRKTKKDNVPLWNHTSIQLTWNLLLPLAAGGLFVLALLQHAVWYFVASACLVFYGLALLNASKYTLSAIRYLGISEIILGLVATQYLTKGLLFWTLGFGVLHIVYGFIMWWKNERKPTATYD